MAKSALNIEVKLTPRAARDQIAGFRDGVLICRVTAPPVDERANRALIKLVAKRLGVAPSRVRMVRGARSRTKLLSVEGAPADARERLA